MQGLADSPDLGYPTAAVPTIALTLAVLRAAPSHWRPRDRQRRRSSLVAPARGERMSRAQSCSFTPQAEVCVSWPLRRSSGSMPSCVCSVSEVDYGKALEWYGAHKPYLCPSLVTRCGRCRWPGSQFGLE